jgi:hypothetical protein
MATIDHEALDKEADAEIAELYGIDTAISPDSLETSTESNKNTDVVDPDKDAGTVEPINDAEETVPKSRYDAAVRAMNDAQREAAALRNQVGPIEAENQQLKQQITALQQNKSDVDADPDDVSNYSLDQAQKLYPELTAAFKEIADLKAQLSTVTKDFGNVKTVTDEFQQTAQLTAAQQHFAAIDAAHPDRKEIMASPEFSDWLINQGPLTQQAIRQGTTRDVISAFDLFRAAHPRAKQAADQSKADKLAAARDASNPNIKTTQRAEGKVKYTLRMIDAMDAKEYARHEDAIDAALAAGEVEP